MARWRSDAMSAGEPRLEPREAPDFAGTWESDTVAFEDATRFSIELETARAWNGGVPDSDRADTLVRSYCSKVRRSPNTLVGRLAGAFKLDNVGIVTLSFVLLAYMSNKGSFNTFRLGSLACGFSIPDLALFRKRLNDGTGFMRLMDKFENDIFPKPEVLSMAPGNDYWWSRLRREIASLPVHAQRNE